MSLPILTVELIEAFILAFVRISGMLIMIPVFGDKVVPGAIKWGLSLLLTMILFPLIRTSIPPLGDLEFLPLALNIAGELLIGIIIGFTAKLIFAGVQLAGEMLGFQMGFSIANVIDPITNLQISTVAEFYYLLAALLFLTVDAHHIFITAIAESYRLVTPLSGHFSGELVQTLTNLSQAVFIIAIKVSAPVMAVLLFTNVAMGVVARTVPQMNVFMVAFPLQIAIGFIFLGLTAPVFVKLVQGFFFRFAGDIHMLLRIM